MAFSTGSIIGSAMLGAVAGGADAEGKILDEDRQQQMALARAQFLNDLQKGAYRDQIQAQLDTLPQKQQIETQGAVARQQALLPGELEKEARQVRVVAPGSTVVTPQPDKLEPIQGEGADGSTIEGQMSTPQPPAPFTAPTRLSPEQASYYSAHAREADARAARYDAESQAIASGERYGAQRGPAGRSAGNWNAFDGQVRALASKAMTFTDPITEKPTLDREGFTALTAAASALGRSNQDMSPAEAVEEARIRVEEQRQIRQDALKQAKREADQGIGIGDSVQKFTFANADQRNAWINERARQLTKMRTGGGSSNTAEASRGGDVSDLQRDIGAATGDATNNPTSYRGATPPRAYPDARRAGDGNWYVQRGGSYYRVNESPTSSPNYATPEDVRAAFRSGKINRDEATRQLTERFGFTSNSSQRQSTPTSSAFAPPVSPTAPPAEVDTVPRVQTDAGGNWSVAPSTAAVQASAQPAPRSEAPRRSTPAGLIESAYATDKESDYTPPPDSQAGRVAERHAAIRAANAAALEPVQYRANQLEAQKQAVLRNYEKENENYAPPPDSPAGRRAAAMEDARRQSEANTRAFRARVAELTGKARDAIKESDAVAASQIQDSAAFGSLPDDIKSAIYTLVRRGR